MIQGKNQKNKKKISENQSKIQKNKKADSFKVDFFPKKSLGQNFLKNSQISEKIVKEAEIKEGDKVLEIGPGTGVLTQILIKKGAKVVAIEKDKRLKLFLKEKFRNQPITIIEGDILKVNLPLILKETGFAQYKIVANIPYYITGQFLRLIFETEFLQTPQLIVLMVQKEVAERICAVSPQMNLLSVSIQYFSNSQVVGYVSRNNFFPKPKVDSAILKIKPKGKKPREENTKLFFRVVKIGFSRKRKKLINNLSGGLRITKKELDQIFDNVGIEVNARAQDLTIEEWKKLTNELKPLI